MRLAVKRGSLSGALGLIGSGVTIVAPPEAKVVGFLLILAGLLVFLFDVEIQNGHVTVGGPDRRRRMIPLIGMIVSGVCFIGFAGWYFWPTRAPENAPVYLSDIAIRTGPTIQEIELEGTAAKASSRLHILVESAFWTGTAWERQDSPPALSLSDIYKGQRVTVPITTYSIGTIAFGAPPKIFGRVYLQAGITRIRIDVFEDDRSLAQYYETAVQFTGATPGKGLQRITLVSLASLQPYSWQH